MQGKLFLSSLVILGSIATASAADLPSEKGPPVYAPPPPPAFSWTGFYIGAQVGYAWQNESQSLYRDDGTFYNTTGVHPAGVVGGLHAGYNWQISQFVFGIEADGEGKGVRESYAIGAPFANTTGTSDSNYQGSIRGRVGIAFDRVLLFATGGATFAHFQDTFSTPPTFFDSPGSERTGWTVGGGLEYAIDNNWSVQAEYRYTDFGTFRNNLPNFLAPPGYSLDRVNEQSVEVGFSYKFDFAPPPAPPVVAKY